LYGWNGSQYGWNGQAWSFPHFTGCGCVPLSRVLLPGYPVVEIAEVTIDGVVLAASEYRLDEYRYLTRIGDTDGSPNTWPSCQALEKPLGEPGTWGVTVTYGQSPPNLGQDAATQLACELYRACDPDAECRLPYGVTRIIRQGLTIERLPSLTWAFQGQQDGRGQWRTGIPLVDAFLGAYNPAGLIRRPTTWSASGGAYARRYG
jgi:hypothetical protein